MARVDQVLSGFVSGDAISLEAVCLRDALREMGMESDIYADPRHIAPDMVGKCRSLDDLSSRPEDVLIHHFSIASPAGDAYLSSRAKKVMIYHNITPPEFFKGYSDAMVEQLLDARRRLAEMGRASDAVWADSRFNADEVTDLGVEDVRVFPLAFSPRAWDRTPDRVILDEKYPGPLTNILFVGRIAPNKCIEELIQMFAYYHYNINPQSRLIIVGSERSAPKYFAMLRMLAGEMDLQNVCFERYASPAGLTACYEVADLFITASRHEGYCLPLVEAMYKERPVLARATGGMPEALGGAGVLFDDLDPKLLAELAHRVLSDNLLRDEVLASQKTRMAELLQRSLESELRERLAPLGR